MKFAFCGTVNLILPGTTVHVAYPPQTAFSARIKSSFVETVQFVSSLKCSTIMQQGKPFVSLCCHTLGKRKYATFNLINYLHSSGEKRKVKSLLL